MKHVGLGLLVPISILAAGCVGAPPPHDEVPSSEAASNGPQAGVYLDLAQKELDQGKTLMQQGKNREAALMLERAQADAEVASAFAQESRTKIAAQQAKARAQALRADLPNSAIGGGPLQSPNPSEPGPTPIQLSGPMAPPAQAPAQPHP